MTLSIARLFVCSKCDKAGMSNSLRVKGHIEVNLFSSGLDQYNSVKIKNRTLNCIFRFNTV